MRLCLLRRRFHTSCLSHIDRANYLFTIVDGTLLSSTLQGQQRKQFLSELMGLCGATSKICEAARSDKEVRYFNFIFVLYGTSHPRRLRTGVILLHRWTKFYLLSHVIKFVFHRHRVHRQYLGTCIYLTILFLFHLRQK